MSKGLLIGRFQPIHLGHISAIKQALKEVDFLSIGIGSAQLDHQEKNPFTVEERSEMIKQTLSENGIQKDQYQTIPIPDINDNPKWPAHVRSLIPDFDILFIGNDGIVKELFEKYDDVPMHKIKEEVPICASKIREEMVKDGDWEKYLSESTVKYLKEIDGVGRIVTK